MHRWVQHPPFISPNRFGGGSFSSTKHGAAPGRHLERSFSRRKPGRHTVSETGQGGPSWSHSSPLPSSGGTSEAILFSRPNDFLLSYSLLTLFQSSPLPYLLLFEPRSCNPQSPFFSFYFLVHSRRRALIETAKGYDSEPSRPCFTVGKILLSAQFHIRCWRLHLLDKTSASKCRLAKTVSQEQEEDTGDQMLTNILQKLKKAHYCLANGNKLWPVLLLNSSMEAFSSGSQFGTSFFRALWPHLPLPV